MWRQLARDNHTLRELLWLEHGHNGPALYGDDGELQCKACPLDFKRDSVDHIYGVLVSARLSVGANEPAGPRTDTNAKAR